VDGVESRVSAEYMCESLLSGIAGLVASS
jgi:hypothetical protein